MSNRNIAKNLPLKWRSNININTGYMYRVNILNCINMDGITSGLWVNHIDKFLDQQDYWGEQVTIQTMECKVVLPQE